MRPRDAMRTTIDLDDDVAAAVARMRKDEGKGLSEAVNELARRGLTVKKERKPYVHKTYDLGIPKMNLDNIGEVLEQLEGPNWR